MLGENCSTPRAPCTTYLAKWIIMLATYSCLWSLLNAPESARKGVSTRDKNSSNLAVLSVQRDKVFFGRILHSSAAFSRVSTYNAVHLLLCSTSSNNWVRAQASSKSR